MRFAIALVALLVAGPSSVARGEVAITADFPGGNVIVEKNDGGTIQIAPDLRGGEAWFYWCFDAQSSQPGQVTFVFNKSPKLAARGPAVSRDEGRTWQWLGTEQVEFDVPVTTEKGIIKQDRFTFTFTKPNERVRLAVAIPYLQHDLDKFLAAQASNPHLKRRDLSRTRGGNVVELLEVGEAGEGKQAMLVTARHHACESMASYVLEGLLREAISDSPAGVEFRRRFRLFCVPIVDKDGVQAGDQGKNRHPHDHNRDYGENPLYPEIRAIQSLGEEHDIHYELDLHCPYLRGDLHEAFHFLGLGLPHVRDNVAELNDCLKEQRPPIAMAPLSFLVDPQKPGAINPRIGSHHFALRKNSVFAATLEIPYAQPNCPLDQDLARAFGSAIVKAWLMAKFLPEQTDTARVPSEHARLSAIRTTFARSYRGQPQAAEETALKLRESTAVIDRCEGLNLLATLRLHQKKFAEAVTLCDQLLGDAHATTAQRATAVLLRLQSVASNPASTPAQVERRLSEALEFSYPANEHRSKVLETVAEYYAGREQWTRAIELTRRQRETAAGYEQGKLLNRIAGYYDRLDQPAAALATRREAVTLLRTQLDPVPQSVFGAMMAIELFDALQSIHDASRDEKQAAATLVLEHKVVTEAVKQRVRKAMGM